MVTQRSGRGVGDKGQVAIDGMEFLWQRPEVETFYISF